MTRRMVAAAMAILASLLLAGCGGSAAAAPTPTPTAAPTPTPSPTKIPQESKTVSGHNATVTNKFNLAPGPYRVTWSATGEHFFAITVHSGQFQQSIANVVLPSPNSGQALLDACPDCPPTDVGVFYLEVQAEGADVNWTVTFDPVQ